MPLNNKAIFETKLQTAVNAVGTSTPNEDLFFLASAVNDLCADRMSSVATIAALPDATTTVSGQIIHVDEIGKPVINTQLTRWETLTGTIVRKDACNHELWAWGSNGAYKFLMNCPDDRYSSPVILTAAGATNWQCILKSGWAHQGGIRRDNTLWSWGYNSQGQLGDNTATHRSSPVTTAGGGTNWCHASLGGIHSVGIKTDGTLWTWGNGGYGQLGNGSTVDTSSPGSISGSGNTWKTTGSGGYVTGGIKTDGALWIWGWGEYGQLGNDTTLNRSSPVTIAGGGTNWCLVAGAGISMSALKTDGTLWTWGYNGKGALGDGDTVDRSSPVTTAGGGTNWCLVAGGYSQFAGIKTDGTLWMWGCSASGSLGDNSILHRSSPFTTAGGGTNWCTVSPNLTGTYAIKTDGTLWTWGDNSIGTLGDGTVLNRSSPVTTAGGGTNWCLVAGARNTVFGLRMT